MKRYVLPLFLIAVAPALTGCTAEQQRDTQTSVQQAASAVPGVAQNTVLAAAVATKLAGIDIDSSTAVHVDANNGHVTLSGQAKSSQERAAYVQAARSVSGVRSVRDALSVNRNMRGIKQNASDAALLLRVSGAIAAQAGVNVFHVTPAVKDGAVTLTGSVPNPSIKSTILTTVRGLSGVKSVRDRIAVRS